MELSQMCVQGMWERDSPLLQLPHFTRSLAKAAAGAGVESVFDLMDMEDEDRTALLKMTPAQMADVARVANAYPNVDVAHQVGGKGPRTHHTACMHTHAGVECGEWLVTRSHLPLRAYLDGGLRQTLHTLHWYNGHYASDTPYPIPPSPD